MFTLLDGCRILLKLYVLAIIYSLPGSVLLPDRNRSFILFAWSFSLQFSSSVINDHSGLVADQIAFFGNVPCQYCHSWLLLVTMLVGMLVYGRRG
jgi:hypothetical protein